MFGKLYLLGPYFFSICLNLVSILKKFDAIRFFPLGLYYQRSRGVTYQIMVFFFNFF